MIRGEFRPWGMLQDVVNQHDVQMWSLIAAVSTEDRCLTASTVLNQLAKRGPALILRIDDADSRFKDEVVRRTDDRQQDFVRIGHQIEDFRRYGLLDRHGLIVEELRQFIGQSGADLVIDISCLPKKYFFVLLRLALESLQVRNIIVTYTEPHAYHDGTLAENPQAWSPLPGFLPPRVEPDNQVLIIGLGFEPLGLPDLYSSGLFGNAQIRLLFPFPASPPNVARNWDFARLLEPVPGNAARHIERIDSSNVSDTFDRLVSLTGSCDSYPVLAPFGPKPMSLAMCLFASAFASAERRPSVYYTQPTVYNPNYSSGVRMRDGRAVIYGYCVKLNGRSLYSAI